MSGSPSSMLLSSPPQTMFELHDQGSGDKKRSNRFGVIWKGSAPLSSEDQFFQMKKLERKDFGDHYRRCHNIILSEYDCLARKSGEREFYCHICRMTFVGQVCFVVVGGRGGEMQRKDVNNAEKLASIFRDDSSSRKSDKKKDLSEEEENVLPQKHGQNSREHNAVFVKESSSVLAKADLKSPSDLANNDKVASKQMTKLTAKAQGSVINENESTSVKNQHPTTAKAGKRRFACKCPNCKDRDRTRSKGSQKKHVCHIPDCNKVFVRTNHLRSHLRWHNGEMIYMCNKILCGKRFTRSDQLRRHERIHTTRAIRPFQCKQCHKKFQRSDHLSKHVKTHDKNLTSSSKLSATVMTAARAEQSNHSKSLQNCPDGDSSEDDNEDDDNDGANIGGCERGDTRAEMQPEEVQSKSSESDSNFGEGSLFSDMEGVGNLFKTVIGERNERVVVPLLKRRQFKKIL